MNRTLITLLSLMGLSSIPLSVLAAEVDARPPNRLTLSASAADQDGVDDAGGGSLNYLHYITPDALFGVGAEYQFVDEANLTFGSARGAWSRGETGSRTTFVGEAHYGEGDDDGRDFDYSVFALSITQGLTKNISVEVEAREIDIDTTYGTLPKLGISYVWSPRLLTYVAYAKSFNGNLGTELWTGRLDYYGKHVNFKMGGASGRANPAVLDVLVDQELADQGITRPAIQSKQGYVGIGKTFSRGEIQLLADYLDTGDAEKVTLTLSFTAYLGARLTR